MFCLVPDAGSRHLLSTSIGEELNYSSIANMSDDSNTSHSSILENCDFERAHVPAGWVVSHALCIMVFFIGKYLVQS